MSITTSLTLFRSILKFKPHHFPRLTSCPIMSVRAKHEDSATSHRVQFTGSGIDKLRELIHSDPFGGWDRCWVEGLSPWDLGKPTPMLHHLVQTSTLPNGTALVPGCGSGYDVVTLASPERYVVGLDISDFALERARQLASATPSTNFSFLKADFFTWEPTEQFDLIFDYTFFCAIEPHMRPAWARRMDSLLKPDGELITLMFPMDDHDGGPPYKTSVADYEDILHPLGFQAISVVDNELAVSGRQGMEKLGRWRRMIRASPL